MANAVVAAWASCIKEFQQLMRKSEDVQRAELKALAQRVHKLEQQPSLPHAAWKKLVYDVQVTYF